MIVTCIGKLNVDCNYSVDQIKIGQNHVSQQLEMSLGGKATNVAVAMRKLGIKTQIIADIGDDEFGKRAIEELNSFAVEPLLTVKPDSRTGFTFIVIENDGKNTMFNYPGANALLTLEDICKYERELRNSDIVFYQAGAGKQEEIIKYLKTLKIPIFLELSEPLETELLDGIDYISLNEEESIRITKAENTFDALVKLLSYGIKSIFLKLGDKGSIYANEEKIIYGKAYKITPVDTTGAGDSFSAGCIYAILHKFKVEEILDFANKCGALTCTRKGTTKAFPTKEEVEIFKAQRYI